MVAVIAAAFALKALQIASWTARKDYLAYCQELQVSAGL